MLADNGASKRLCRYFIYKTAVSSYDSHWNVIKNVISEQFDVLKSALLLNTSTFLSDL